MVAHKPVESRLLVLISSGGMPMGAPPLEAGAIDLVRRWIEAGMPGETPQAPVPAAAPPVREREVMAAILGAKCLPCHGRRRQEAALDLRTREGLLKGGKSGPAVVPGKPEESLLVRRIRAQEMPPPHLQEQFSVRGLTSVELEKVQAWIAGGALPDPEKPLEADLGREPLVGPKDHRFWSFQAPRRPAQPRVTAQDRIGNPVDAFLLARLEEEGLSFSPPADRLTLMRRSYLDLTGLPPSPEEIRSFLADTDPRAYERLVDRLLESPHYGERWARYWLDAVGYADSEGGVSSDNIRPHAFRYRDYIIRSLNADKPYDQLLIEQIAGDELFDYKAVDKYSPDQLDWLVATGFLRMGPDSTYSTEQNNLPERLDVVATQIEILSSSTMGLTLACARCHDHKYDPLPQRGLLSPERHFEDSLRSLRLVVPQYGLHRGGSQVRRVQHPLVAVAFGRRVAAGRRVQRAHSTQDRGAGTAIGGESPSPPQDAPRGKNGGPASVPAAGPERGLKGEAPKIEPRFRNICWASSRLRFQVTQADVLQRFPGLCRDLQGDRGADQG